MRISRWGLFWAIGGIKLQLERYDVVLAELRAIDRAKVAELVPDTNEWVENWERIYDSVKR